MPPAETIQRLNIFISSPGDLTAEREAAKCAIDRLERLKFISEKYHLKALAYESEVPPANGIGAQMAVDRYMAPPDDVFLMVCLFWTRMGTAFTHPDTGQRYDSGTEYEWRVAYEVHLKHGYPRLLLYRKTSDNPGADATQKARVDQFFQRFHTQPDGSEPGFKGLYQNFTDAAEFEQLVYNHIEHMVTEYMENSRNNMTSSEDPRSRTTNTTINGDVTGDNVFIGVGTVTIGDHKNTDRLLQIKLRLDELERDKARYKKRHKVLEAQRTDAVRDAVGADDMARDSAMQRQSLMRLGGLLAVAVLALLLALTVDWIVGGLVGAIGAVGVLSLAGRLSGETQAPEGNVRVREIDASMAKVQNHIKEIEDEQTSLNREAKSLTR